MGENINVSLEKLKHENKMRELAYERDTQMILLNENYRLANMPVIQQQYLQQAPQYPQQPQQYQYQPQQPETEKEKSERKYKYGGSVQ